MRVPAAVKIYRAHKNGIKNPVLVWNECKRAGVNFAAVCAFLEKESGGGDNVFGHDKDSSGRIIFHGQTGRVPVTKERYLEYRTFRRRTGKMQGVGPMQLTWYSFQDNADKLGGCWIPKYNIREALRIIKEDRLAGKNWWQVAREYNGAEEYANDFIMKFQKWQRILNAPLLRSEK